MTLWDLPSKQLAVVTRIHNSIVSAVTERLSEMGLQEGREILCLRKGPLGGPIVLQLGGSIFAIESQLAAQIEVAPAS